MLYNEVKVLNYTIDYGLILTTSLFPAFLQVYVSETFVSIFSHTHTTHADCKSMNLIYQLKCSECNAFYIGETRNSLSNRMNGHRFTTTVSNPDLPVAIHTKSHQIPFQKCWSVSVIHKLPDSTPDHICHQFETAYQLVLQS